MLTRDFRRPKERTRHTLKPLFSHIFLPTPTTTARLDIRLRRATLYPAELRVHTVREVLTPCLREIFVGLKSEPDIRSNRCLVTSFFQHQQPSPDLTSAFGGQRSIQLSYGCIQSGARPDERRIQYGETPENAREETYVSALKFDRNH